MQRVDLFNLVWRQSHGSPIGRLKGENSLPHIRRRYLYELADGAAVEAFFVIEEEEHAILLDRASQRETELIAVQRLARYAGAVIEPVVGRKDGVAIEFVGRSVQPVGAALGDQC